jgi:hypothetical protein
MVHADVAIARRRQSLDGQLQQAEFRLPVRQILRIDPALGLEQLWHVRVAIDREAIGSYGDQRIQRVRESGGCLPRQTIDQIDIHRTEPALATGGNRGKSLFDALDAIDGELDFRSEVLNTKAGPVEAHLCEVGYVALRDETRIQLDRKVPAGRGAEVEPAAQCREQSFQFVGLEKVGRTAAEMQLYDFAVRGEKSRCQVDLVLQAAQVEAALSPVSRNEAIAAAVKAGGLAIGNMQIEREWVRNALVVTAPRVIAQLGLAEGAVELRCRRIRRVAGAGRS